jgi:hypothetical protein
MDVKKAALGGLCGFKSIAVYSPRQSNFPLILNRRRSDK